MVGLKRPQDFRGSLLLVEIDAQGRCNYIFFRQNNIGNSIIQNAINFPLPSQIDNTNRRIPLYIVVNDAIPLLKNRMRPFPE